MFGASSESQRGSRLCSYAVTMRVLVVEDEERMASLLRRALEEEGHAVDVARDGPGAKRRRPDRGSRGADSAKAAAPRKRSGVRRQGGGGRRDIPSRGE